jgi:hypothetical protein
MLFNQENDMKKICLLLLSVFMLLNVSPASGETDQNEMEESSRQFQQWTKSLAEFVKDVRFNEEDVQSLISQWDDFNTIGGEEADEEEEFIDFNTILNDAEYLSWAKSRGLDSDIWLKKTMRIMAIIMRAEIEENSSGEAFDMKTQLEELEEMRTQVGEEAYQQMKQALEAGAAMMQGMEDFHKHLPVPSDTEKALLTKYRDQLMNLE